ncbi:DUF3265 domain-containing protein [Vibrio parahaemolyticus]|nr:DUF3265 domain-containing protein [Vibrio parahaemolyticus]
MHAAWHFWYAVSFSGESGLRKLGLGGIHPLTRRYKPHAISCGLYQVVSRLGTVKYMFYYFIMG